MLLSTYRHIFGCAQKGFLMIVVVRNGFDTDRFNHTVFKHLPHKTMNSVEFEKYRTNNDMRKHYVLLMDNNIPEALLLPYGYAFYDCLANPELMIDEIEVTNFCNLRCEYCCQQSINIEKGFISLDTVKTAIPHFVKDQNLCIHGHGEPLLHPDILGIIKILSDEQIHVEMSTNGLLLTEEVINELQAVGLRYLVVSLHSNESFFALKRLGEMKIKRGINFQFHANSFEGDEDTRKRFENIGGNWDDIITDVRYQRLITWGGKSKQRDAVVVDNIDDALNRCYYKLNNCVYMKWNGIIVPCCLDCNNEDVIGHISNIGDVCFNKMTKINCSHCDF